MFSKKITLEDAFSSTIAPKQGFIEKVGDVSLELHQHSSMDPKRARFEKVLSQWINEYTAHTHLVVRDFVNDLRTGQIFITFLQQITRDDIAHNDFAQSDQSHRSNIASLLHFIEQELEMSPMDGDEEKWSVEEIFRGNWAHIYNLAVAFAHHFECPYDLPSNLRINIIRREKIKGGDVIKKTTQHIITGDESVYHEANRIRRELKNLPQEDLEDDEAWWALTDDDDRICDHDAFDDLYDRKEHLATVVTTLSNFAIKHLSKLDVEIDDLVEDFSTGVNLIYLIGILTKTFIPLANYNPIPDDYPSSLHNIRFAFKLMDDFEITRTNCKSGDIARGDERSILRILFQIFQKYKGEA